MNIGKLPNDLLSRLIIEPINSGCPSREEILVGPSIGEDCSLLDFGGELVLASTDPITATANNIGKLLLTVCSNDVAACGGTPIGIMISALIPKDATEQDLKAVIDDLNNASKALSIPIIGGHTEVTDAVNRIVLSGTILGKVEKGKYVNSGGAQVGDKVIMTKSAGLEGTAILALDYSEQLKAAFSDSFVLECQKYSEMTSVLKESKIAAEFGVSAMHDVTEGGIFGASAEFSDACGHGLAIMQENIPVADETVKICEYFGISPYNLISSGSLLIAARDGDGLVRELQESGVGCAIIGEVIDGESCIIGSDGMSTPLKAPKADAIYSVRRKKMDRKNVLFVCTGNTCRSPMAEGFAKKFASERLGEYTFVSRGIFVGFNVKVAEKSVSVMKGFDIDISNITPTMLDINDVYNAGLILTMTKEHKNYILDKFDGVNNIKNLKDKVFTISEFSFGDSYERDISDPFGQSTKFYKQCSLELEKCVSAAIDRIISEY